MLTFKQKIENITFKISLDFDLKLKRKMSNAKKSLTNIPIDNYLLSKREKNKILSVFDSVGLSQQIKSYDEVKKFNNVFFGFSLFLRLNRFHIFKKFDLLLKHAHLVDLLCEVADSTDSTDEDIQRCIDNLEKFFNDFGEMTPSPELNDVLSRCRNCSLTQNKDVLDPYFAYLIFSIFAHLDVIIHYSAFPSIEPICLGWLFMKKIDPNKWDQNGAAKNQHKAMWTNPGRSLIKLMTAFVSFHKNNQVMPKKLYGLNLLDILGSCESDEDDKRANLIKFVQEGRKLSFAEFSWILNDEKLSLDLSDVSNEIKLETLNILKGLDSDQNKESDSMGFNNLIGIWLVYWFFQFLYERQEDSNKNQATYHGYYYNLWELFSQHYGKKREAGPKFKWSQELIELAEQPCPS